MKCRNSVEVKQPGNSRGTEPIIFPRVFVFSEHGSARDALCFRFGMASVKAGAVLRSAVRPLALQVAGPSQSTILVRCIQRTVATEKCGVRARPLSDAESSSHNSPAEPGPGVQANRAAPEKPPRGPPARRLAGPAVVSPASSALVRIADSSPQSIPELAALKYICHDPNAPSTSSHQGCGIPEMWHDRHRCDQ